MNNRQFTIVVVMMTIMMALIMLNFALDEKMAKIIMEMQQIQQRTIIESRPF